MRVFRSRKVKEYGCLITTETAFETISQLLETGDVEIYTNQHENSDSPFIKILLRIRAIRAKLKNVLSNLQNLDIDPIKRFDAKQTDQYIRRKTNYIKKRHQDFLLYLDEFEDKVESEIDKTDKIVENNRTLREQYERAFNQLQVARIKLSLLDDHQTLLQMPQHRDLQIIAGSCEKKNQQRMERMVFRVSKGNSFCFFKTVKDSSGKDQQKVVFLIFMSGGKGSYIYKRVEKLLLTLDSEIFDLPNAEQDIKQHIKLIQRNMKETKPLLLLSQNSLAGEIISLTSPVKSPRIIQQLTEAFYFERIAYILTHQDDLVSGNHLIIRFYKAEGSGSLPQNLPIFEPNVNLKNKTEMPRLPCLNEVNQLVQMFSIPKNNEIIPSIFMLSTVPILFGMMFSDFGHGFLLFSIAMLLDLSPFWKLMGVMSIYFGILFNEFFGMKVAWFWTASNQTFGLAPIWGRAQNSLAFENSLKMKLSMVAAFIHMLFGSCIRVANDIHQRKKANLLLQSIPKLILLVCTVGYLVFLIVYKWTIDWTGRESLAPSIISMYLDMYLGYKDRKTSLFPSIQLQKRIAMCLKVICIICLILIMFGTQIHKRYFGHQKKANMQEQPLVQEIDQQHHEFQENYQQKQNRKKSDEVLSELQNSNQKIKPKVQRKISKIHSDLKKAHNDDEDEHLFGPLQGFQYVLSLISSTTSYLRLFALSLAHQKLSVLLLGFMLSSAASQEPSFVWLSIKSLIFFFITIGMMLLLDVLECMMHVIRLHWVEWMGRFYKGAGYLFKPEEHVLIE